MAVEFEFYHVTILANGEMEAGRNPVFTFGGYKETSKFVELCLNNGYEVEISKVVEEMDDTKE